jgi:predicted deacylase
VHGDESITIEAARQIIDELVAMELVGTVLVLPVLNPLAFESCTRNTWIDMANLSRCFPGRLNGSVSEQMAHVITEAVLKQVDALIDLHSGSPAFICDYSYAFGDDELARAFGSTAVINRPPIPGTAGNVVCERGKPMVIAEFGGGLFRDAFYIQKGVTGTLNCLKQLNMLPGEPELATEPVVANRMTLFRPRNGGLLEPHVTGTDLGERISKGTLLGRVLSPYTFQVLEEFIAPYDHNLITLVASGPIRLHPGDFAYMVAESSDG